MNPQNILKVETKKLVDRIGLRPAARQLDMPVGQLRCILDDRTPLFSNALQALSALGYDLKIVAKSTSHASENLNQSKFNSENTVLAVPPEIVVALNLPKAASMDDALAAIERLLASQPDNDLVALRNEISALREAIKKLAVGTNGD